MAANPLVIRCQAKTHDKFVQVVLSEPKKEKQKDDLCQPFLETMVKEVKRQPYIVQKKFIQLMQMVQIGIAPFLATPKAYAAEHIRFPILDKAYGLDILPDEVVDLLIQIIVGCGILGVAFAMLCFMIAGGYRMIGQVDKARTWSVDIIKGLGQVLIGPAIILVLASIVGLIFHNIPGLNIFY